MDFCAFPKITRLSREVIITEKIDGTNGCIKIGEDGSLQVGSRTRWLTNVFDDNFGFLYWALINKNALLKLGPGTHFGEWWGSKIQRGYGLIGGEKRFSLFNVSRWGENSVLPTCCSVVPVLWKGIFNTHKVEECLDLLRRDGSVASPGFMKPEGVVVFHTASGYLFKKTLEGDEKLKKSNEEVI